MKNSSIVLVWGFLIIVLILSCITLYFNVIYFNYDYHRYPQIVNSILGITIFTLFILKKSKWQIMLLFWSISQILFVEYIDIQNSLIYTFFNFSQLRSFTGFNISYRSFNFYLYLRFKYIFVDNPNILWLFQINIYGLFYTILSYLIYRKFNISKKIIEDLDILE